MPSSHQNLQHYAILDTIRGFAALWVFVAHSFHPAGITKHIPIVTDGRAAVDLFMILSGFLIFDRYANNKGANTWSKYFIARIFRICPLYYVLLIAAALLLLPPGTDLISWIGYRLTFIFGLFPSLIDPAPLPDWSLALEMQFYLSFPLLIFIGHKYGWTPVFLLSTVLSATFYLFFTVYTVNPPGILGNFSQPTLLFAKLPMFLLGVLIALGRNIPTRTCITLHLINLTGIIFPAISNIGFKSSVLIYCFALLICLATTWSTISQSNYFHRQMQWATHPVFCFLGAISYALYLFHVFVFYALQTFFTATSLRSLDNIPRYALFFAIAAAISIPGSYLLHIWIEKPGIHLGKRISRALFPAAS